MRQLLYILFETLLVWPCYSQFENKAELGFSGKGFSSVVSLPALHSSIPSLFPATPLLQSLLSLHLHAMTQYICQRLHPEQLSAAAQG